MDRKDFLRLTGMGAGAFVLASCFGSCKKDSVPAPSNVDFTLDLSQAANSSLNQVGGYVYNSGVIVAKAVSGNYIAVSAACTHQGNNVQYVISQDQFYCPAHGSAFADNGSVLGGPAPSSLKKYSTALSGNLLRVYG